MNPFINSKWLSASEISASPIISRRFDIYAPIESAELCITRLVEIHDPTAASCDRISVELRRENARFVRSLELSDRIEAEGGVN